MRGTDRRPCGHGKTVFRARTASGGHRPSDRGGCGGTLISRLVATKNAKQMSGPLFSAAAFLTRPYHKGLWTGFFIFSYPDIRPGTLRVTPRRSLCGEVLGTLTKTTFASYKNWSSTESQWYWRKNICWLSFCRTYRYLKDVNVIRSITRNSKLCVHLNVISIKTLYNVDCGLFFFFCIIHYV